MEQILFRSITCILLVQVSVTSAHPRPRRSSEEKHSETISLLSEVIERLQDDERNDEYVKSRYSQVIMALESEVMDYISESTKMGDRMRALRMLQILQNAMEDTDSEYGDDQRKNFLSDVLRLGASVPNMALNLVSDPTPPPFMPPSHSPMYLYNSGYYKRRSMEPTGDSPSSPPHMFRKGLFENVAKNALENVKSGIYRIADILDYKPPPKPQPRTFIMTQPQYK